MTLVDEDEMRKQVASDVRKTLAGGNGQAENAATNLADSKREAEKLIMSKASSYTTAKQRASNLMEILDE